MSGFWDNVIGNVIAGLVVAAVVGGISFLPKVRAWIKEQPRAVAGLIGGFAGLLTGIIGSSLSYPEFRGDLPRGSVLAFESECPTGWERYEKAAARFIIAAASKDELDAGPAKFRNGSDGKPLTARPLGEHEGTENVTLEETHMPSHGHDFVGSKVARGGYDSNPEITSSLSAGRGEKQENWSPTGTISPAYGGVNGKADPHNNMPPYIALNFCQYKGTG